MSVKVMGLELAQPIQPLNDIDTTRYSQVQLLVRYHSRPLGYVWIKTSNPRFLEADYIQFEIERQLFADPTKKDLTKQVHLPAVEDDTFDWPPATVIICSRERPESLKQFLLSLANLSYPKEKLEILVVDNAPTNDSTKLVVAEFANVRYVMEPRPGLNWARNRGVIEAKHEILAFTDDDVCLDRWWLRAVARHFSDPQVMCVTGLVVPAERETEAQDLFEEYNGFGKGFEYHYYLIEPQKPLPKFLLGAGNFGTGANMVFSRHTFKELGLFDVSLGAGTITRGASDTEMFFRVIRSGFALVYDPEALLWHYHRKTLPQLERQISSWGSGTYAHWTKVFLTDSQMRIITLNLATKWFMQHYILGQYRINKPELRHLRKIEMIGAIQGPFLYFLAQREAKKIVQKFGPLAWSSIDTKFIEKM